MAPNFCKDYYAIPGAPRHVKTGYMHNYCLNRYENTNPSPLLTLTQPSKESDTV